MGGIRHPLVSVQFPWHRAIPSRFICRSIGILEAIDITSYGMAEYINSS